MFRHARAIGLVIGGGNVEFARLWRWAAGPEVFNRDDERDADLVGSGVSCRRAGYDPQGFITLWQKMTQAAKGTVDLAVDAIPSGARTASCCAPGQ